MPYPNINAERSRAGMTVEDLAKSLGVTRKTVYNWMAHGNIPQSKLEKMSELFHCSIDYLLEKRVKQMKIEITGEPKEIAALVLAVQERQSQSNLAHKRVIEDSGEADQVMTARLSSENIR